MRENIKKNIKINKTYLKNLKSIKNQYKPKKKRGRKSLIEKKLEKRFIVEHSFSWFKKYKRLVLRRDSNYAIFESFVFFGAANIIANKVAHVMNIFN
jgi:hypothetical protein